MFRTIIISSNRSKRSSCKQLTPFDDIQKRGHLSFPPPHWHLARVHSATCTARFSFFLPLYILMKPPTPSRPLGLSVLAAAAATALLSECHGSIPLPLRPCGKADNTWASVLEILLRQKRKSLQLTLTIPETISTDGVFTGSVWSKIPRSRVRHLVHCISECTPRLPLTALNVNSLSLQPSFVTFILLYYIVLRYWENTSSSSTIYMQFSVAIFSKVSITSSIVSTCATALFSPVVGQSLRDDKALNLIPAVTWASWTNGSPLLKHCSITLDSYFCASDLMTCKITLWLIEPVLMLISLLFTVLCPFAPLWLFIMTHKKCPLGHSSPP